MQPHSNDICRERAERQHLFISSSNTALKRTKLSLQDKVALSTHALAGSQEHGKKSELAREFGVSRPTVYSAIERVSSVLTSYFDGEKQGSAPVIVKVDKAQLQRAIVALRVMAPNALRPIEDMISILYPGVSVSYGKVQQIVSEAEHRAVEWNSRMDLSKIVVGALDEMYSQGQPVLGGVDLDSGALFTLSLRDSRSGDDWAEELTSCKRQGMQLEIVVKDAAIGIEAGVREVYKDAEQRDDCFHAHYEMGKVLRVLEQRAYGAIAQEEKIRQRIKHLRRTGRGGVRSTLAGRLSMKTFLCNQAIQLHDRFEVAMRMVQEAMEIVELRTGQIRTFEQSQAAIQEAATIIMKLDEPKCRKVGKYIYNRAPGLAKYMIQINQQLQQLTLSYGQESVSIACVFCRLVREFKRKRYTFESRLRKQRLHLLAAVATLRKLLGTQAQVDALLDCVDEIFEHRHRASSAIEGFNAALRPFLYVHKGVSQNFLELFRAYYNLRARKWGRHKGTSAYECLTGEHVNDWLSLLGYPPSSTAAALN